MEALEAYVAEESKKARRILVVLQDLDAISRFRHRSGSRALAVTQGIRALLGYNVDLVIITCPITDSYFQEAWRRVASSNGTVVHYV